ncbi:hypothetical protein Droror1_Dr00028213 [Drosera rotundifolia]
MFRFPDCYWRERRLVTGDASLAHHRLITRPFATALSCIYATAMVAFDANAGGAVSCSWFCGVAGGLAGDVCSLKNSQTYPLSGRDMKFALFRGDDCSHIWPSQWAGGGRLWRVDVDEGRWSFCVARISKTKLVLLISSFELEDLSVWDGFEGVTSFEVEFSGVGNPTSGLVSKLI